MDTILIILITSVCTTVFTYWIHVKFGLGKYMLDRIMNRMIQELNGANSKPQDTFSPASMESNELTVTKRGSRIKSAELHTLEGDFLHQKAIATQKNDLLHVLLEASTHGILAVDTDWSVIAINNLFCETWGLSKNTVYAGTDGWKILEFCMKQTADPERFTFHFRKFLDAPNMFWNTHLYLSNGKIFKSFSAPIIGLNGRRQGRVWEIIDITDDLLKQQELEEAHTALVQKGIQLALALESSGEGVWTWDISKDLFSLNPEFASQYHSLYEVQPIAHFFRSAPSGEQKRYLNIFREITKKSSNDRIEFEFRMRTRKNTWRWLILRGVVSDVDSDGVPLIVTGTLVDFTKRKKYENHLRDLNRKILVLSQLTRHDIANQISNLFLLVDALSDTVSDGTVDASTINDMLELMNQGLITVKHQIEFSKDYQELGLHGAKWQSMNKCLEKIGPLLIRPPVELLKGNLPMICADPLLEKALYNLIENSLRHGERVTQIKVTFSVESEYNGVLTFEDNGVGVPNVYKNRIFDKDFGKNTGLGLFLIREIFSLTEMVIAECGKPGQGARFEIQIPSKYWKWEEA